MMIEKIAKALESCSGSGLSFDEPTTFKNGNIQVTGDYRCLNEVGYHDGYVFFAIIISKKTFRLTFSSASKYKAKKYGLREYLEDTIHQALTENNVFDKEEA